MTHVTRRLTAKNRDQLRNPTLGNRVWATFTYYSTTQVQSIWYRCKSCGNCSRDLKRGNEVVSQWTGVSRDWHVAVQLRQSTARHLSSVPTNVVFSQKKLRDHKNTTQPAFSICLTYSPLSVQCFDAVRWAAGRASGL